VISRNPKWSERKRALFSNTCYDIIRWWRLLWTALGKEPSFDDRALWHLLGSYMIKMEGEAPDRAEYKGMSPARVKKRYVSISSKRSIRESIPEHLDQLGESELGEEWDDVLHFLNSYPPLAIRTNTLKIDIDDLKNRLHNEGYDSQRIEFSPDALVLKKKGNVFKLKSFQNGLFEVQDPASQMVAPFLQVEPGMRVIDACAGQGGKTLHLSCLMENKGQLIAMDDVEWKLEELMKRAKRAGCQNIRTIHVTGTKSFKRMKGSAERLLLDVPCTGLGALRRNPDIKWNFSIEMMERLNGIQKDILRSYSNLVNSEGKMVYATCSILPSEGEEQIQWFLNEFPSWSLEEEKRMRPDREGFDGFYMARLVNTCSPS
jgi:16S rRNA (cytosine967-C5)-methyltransferase